MVARKQRAGWLPLLFGVLSAGGCASTGAPDGWLSPAAEAPSDPYGSWVTVEFVESHEYDFLAGEFIAVDQDSLYVLSGLAPVEDPISAIPLGVVAKAKIAHFDPETGRIIGWVVAGSVSTLSHGLGAAITFPIWTIMGSAIAGGHSRAPLENYPNLTWSELRMYARFPQGPPPDLHQLGLRPKRQDYQVPEPVPANAEFNY